MSQLNQFILYDELPIWSAPFGLTLLDTIRVKKGINILDIGSGAGFPMLEIAERFGKSVTVYGMDPSPDSISMISEKIRIKEISNANIIIGVAEEIPFEDHFFGLIVANNGLNNVQDDHKALAECRRVLEPNGQMVLTMNLPHTFIEFYNILEEILQEHYLTEELKKLKDHIFVKRKPVEYWKELLETSGFNIRTINMDGFKMKYADGTTFLNHYFIRTAFRKPWENITTDSEIFRAVEDKLNAIAVSTGEIIMSVPFVCFDCYKAE
jgi:ubiquinone/menaquinone biosynthesis C-methylase UbiE